MLPNTGNITDVVLNQSGQEETQTFGLNITKNIIGGKIDGLDAVKQSIYLMLTTEADQYIIYPYTYGVNTLDLIGRPSYYVIAVLPSRITETLLSDDRITDVSDFEFTVNKNKITCTFVVHTIYGEINEETVVRY